MNMVTAPPKPEDKMTWQTKAGVVLGAAIVAALFAALIFTLTADAQQSGGSFTQDCDYIDTGAGLQIDCSGFIPHTPTPGPTPTGTPPPTPTPTAVPPTPTSTPPPGAQVSLCDYRQEGVNMGDDHDYNASGATETGVRFQGVFNDTDCILLGPKGGLLDQTRQGNWCADVKDKHPTYEAWFYHISATLTSQQTPECDAIGFLYHAGDMPDLNNLPVLPNHDLLIVVDGDLPQADIDAAVNRADIAIVQHSLACASGTFGAAIDALPAHPRLLVGLTTRNFGDVPPFLADVDHEVDTATAVGCYNEAEQRGVDVVIFAHPFSSKMDIYTALRNAPQFSRPANFPFCSDNGNNHPCWPPLGTP